jgi:hypothetical protein
LAYLSNARFTTHRLLDRLALAATEATALEPLHGMALHGLQALPVGV